MREATIEELLERLAQAEQKLTEGCYEHFKAGRADERAAIVAYLIGEAGRYTSSDARRAVIDEANAIESGAHRPAEATPTGPEAPMRDGEGGT